MIKIKYKKLLKSLVSLILLVNVVFLTTVVYEESISEVLITFESFENNAIRAIEDLGVKIKHEYNYIPTIVVDVPSSLISTIENIPGVVSVDTNNYYFPTVIPNDPGYSQLWGMDKISGPSAWDITTGSNNVIVAVIDTGVQISHPDLAANIWTNLGEIAGNGIDDDGNGYTDDVNGWDFLNNDNSVYDSVSDDHGTHVSGTIGGVGNNGVGVTGVAWTVKIMPLKFLGSSGGSTADAISAIEYATMNGADIISASWGGGPFEQTLKNAIDAFPGLFVAAAGNDGVDNDASAHYPSSYTSTNILAVASTTSTDSMSSFSNYGVTSVDIGAPGSSIYSTWPSNTYNTISGTSMATPHVSGAAALLLSDDITLTTDQVKAKLMDFSDPIASLDGKVVSGGRLNVHAALTGIAPPPPPPPITDTFTGSVSSGTPNQVHTFDVGSSGSIDATLSWGTSADVDMYLYAPGVDPSGSGWLVRAYTTSNPESMTYSASEIGIYSIRVNLYSGVTSSYTLTVTHPPPSSSDTTPPSQVVGLAANAVSTSQIDLSWTANSESDLANYNIYRDGSLITTSTATSYSDTGLTASTTYSYEISAVDTSGNEGVRSTAVSATTQTPSDTTAPSVTIVSPSGTVSGSVTIDATITDNIGVVSADYRIDGGTWTSLSDAGSDSWVANLDTATLSDASHTIDVRATDAASNLGSDTSSFTVDNGGSPVTDTFTGTVSSGAPDQIFTFGLDSTGDISATLSWSGSADLDMYLYAPGADPNGAGWLIRAYTLSNPENMDYAATLTGTYSIRVNLYSSTTTSFTLSVTHPPGSGSPPPTDVTDTFTGTVSSGTPDLIFTFDLGSTGDIIASLSWVGSADIDMYLYAPGSDPNGSGWLIRAYTLNNPESFTYAATLTGTYSIRVNLYSGESTSFTLTVTHPSP